MKESFLLLGKIAGALMAILTCLGFLGKPFLDDYIDAHIEAYKVEASSKVKLRKLLSDKMGVDEDEVHIELGRMYKKESNIVREIKRHHETLYLNN